MAKLTIIIPNYNHEDFIEQRLKSILDQDFKDWEAVIIDDASTDKSYQLIERFLRKHPKFEVKKLIKNKVNSGSGYKSWQKGIALAETQYIWIAESDDFSSPKFLSETVKILEENPHCALAFSASDYVNETGSFLYDTSKRLSFLKIERDKKKIFEAETMLNQLPLNPVITNASCVVFRNVKQKIPDEIFSYKQSSDLFLWAYLLRGKSFGFINMRLNFFRQHNFSTTVQNYKLRKKTIYKEKVEYLNYFNQTEKYKAFVDHYIRHYVWANKAEVFRFSFLKEIKTNGNISFYYFRSLFRFLISKVLKK